MYKISLEHFVYRTLGGSTEATSERFCRNLRPGTAVDQRSEEIKVLLEGLTSLRMSQEDPVALGHNAEDHRVNGCRWTLRRGLQEQPIAPGQTVLQQLVRLEIDSGRKGHFATEVKPQLQPGLPQCGLSLTERIHSLGHLKSPALVDMRGGDHTFDTGSEEGRGQVFGSSHFARPIVKAGEKMSMQINQRRDQPGLRRLRLAISKASRYRSATSFQL